MARIIFIADTHGSISKAPDKWEKLEDVKDANAIVCLGDIYLNELQILKGIADRLEIPVYGIHGNHEPMSFLKKAGIINIHASECLIEDVRLAGIGGCPAYKDDVGKNELCMLTEAQVLKIAKNLPYADILVTHSPYKIKSSNMIHSGFRGISWYLNHHNPRWHFYGHLHNRDTKTHRFGLLHKRTCKSYGIYEAAVFDTDTEVLEHLF